MFRSSLFRRHYIAVSLVLVAISLALYGISVPMIKSTTYEIEAAAGRNVLNVVYELINRIHLDIETQRRVALEARKSELEHVLALARASVETVGDDLKAGRITRQQAYSRIYQALRRFKYGNDDYIWVSNYDAVLVSHPDDRFQGRDGSGLGGNDAGGAAVPKMVEIARSAGAGFHRYRWSRLGKEQAGEKLSYFEDFPEWGLVIGTGVYLDDVEEDIRLRRESAVRELRDVLSDISIAKTGYLYIFDADLNMLVHPNANIEGTDFSKLLNPLSRRPIGKDLIEKADDPAGLFYLWDSPDDPGNYEYEKISWVRHFKGFDWYIASSVYVDELRRNADELGARILWVALATLVVALLFSWLFIFRLTVPIRRMAETAQRVQAGDLSATTRIESDDEIGILSKAFDNMLARLRDNIDTLDARVVERTVALSQAQDRQRLILDAIPAAIAYIDEQKVVRFANRLFVDGLEPGVGRPLGRELAEVLPADAVSRLAAPMDAAFRGEQQVYEQEDADGRISLKRLIPDRDRKGRVIGLFYLSRDITEERRTGAQLAAAQRMQSVGQLAGGLAHDFNNLLTVVIGNLSAAMDRPDGAEELVEYLEPAIRASRRGAEITGRLLAFSRRQTLAPQPVCVDELVAETIVLLGRSLPGNVVIKLETPDEVCMVDVDVAQLENALVNLAFNARDAMPEGGRLRFSVAARKVNDDAGQDKSSFDEAPRPGEYCEIHVLDTGTGFDEEALQRGVEPFFSTKSAGAGSGLGLSMVYGFVKQSGGYLRLRNDEAGGAEVTLLLPRIQASAVPIPVEGKAVSVDEQDWQGRLVLLVEDDADVRQVIRRDLVSFGLAVVEAGSADEALPLVGVLDDLSLLISDVVTPGVINGVALARQVNESHPRLPILLMSGFSEEVVIDELEGAVRFLRKPFEKDQLRQTVSELLSVKVLDGG